MKSANKWYVYILFGEHQEDWVSDHYETISVENLDDGTCVMEGELLDISQVYGLIIQFRDLNLSFIKLQVELK